MTSRTAEIKLKVDLDDNNLPTHIEWEASEAKHDGANSCQAVLLSLWDAQTQTVAAIDLWTTDITIADMNLHFYQTFHKMADTYLRATKNAEMANKIHEFGDRFGQSLGLA